MKYSKQKEILKKVGDISSIYGITDVTYNSGRPKGVRAFEVKNGKGLELTVFADRGLDIPLLSLNSKNMGFVSKSGLSSPYLYRYTSDGMDSFLRQFTAGFLTTCGITYCGAPTEEDGKFFPLHGAISNAPAENVYTRQVVENDEIILKICGEVRESCIFSENMILRREISVYTEQNKIRIHDIIENRGFKQCPVMMIYHVNFGYPMLDENDRIYMSTDNVEPQTPFAEEGVDKYHIIEAPDNCREEQCYYHYSDDNEEEKIAMLHNEKIGVAAVLKYSSKEFPILCEWKSMQSGDYALGLEPTTNGTHGRSEPVGPVIKLDGQEICEFDFTVEFIEDVDAINNLKKECKESKVN